MNSRVASGNNQRDQRRMRKPAALLEMVDHEMHRLGMGFAMRPGAAFYQT
ncbi:MAG TPA: hypothetical protein VFN67_06905 [Polyangiales bacterium]|nr:hypothetical protein [Polyangiales bacterium]